MHGVHAKMRLHPVLCKHGDPIQICRRRRGEEDTFGNVSPASMSSSTGCHEDAFENINEQENSFEPSELPMCLIPTMRRTPSETTELYGACHDSPATSEEATEICGYFWRLRAMGWELW
jgi:hypothetical protein